MERTGADPGPGRGPHHRLRVARSASSRSTSAATPGSRPGSPRRSPARPSTGSADRRQQAVHFAAQGVIAGAYDLVVASGVESMTPRADGVVDGRRRCPWGERLLARYEGKLVPQGISADLIATKWDITREESRRLRRSGRTFARPRPREPGTSSARSLPLKVTVEGGAQRLLEVDEGIRMEPDRERMATSRRRSRRRSRGDVPRRAALDGDGGQLLADLRRRVGGADRRRARRPSRAGAHAAGAVRVVRAGRRLADPHADRADPGHPPGRSSGPA